METRHDLLRIIKTQLALEYNCSLDDFSSKKNVISVQKNNPGRRHYIDGTFFYQMVTFGDNAVISSNECMHEWLEDYVRDKKGHWMFEHNNLIIIEEKLKEFGEKLSQTHHMFLPLRQISPKEVNIETKWFEQDEIHPFYDMKTFPNALCKEFNPKRPDVLALAAYEGGKIIGMAGCSADTPLLWQIGIDVDEKHQGKGIGTYLVSLLRSEIEKRDKIPFYGTSLSNLPSWGIALNSGFYPAWIEISTIHKGD